MLGRRHCLGLFQEVDSKNIIIKKMFKRNINLLVSICMSKNGFVVLDVGWDVNLLQNETILGMFGLLSTCIILSPLHQNTRKCT
jgi:hypothetical protein